MREGNLLSCTTSQQNCPLAYISTAASRVLLNCLQVVSFIGIQFKSG